MKNLGSVKLNQLSKEELEKRQMNALRGGTGCRSCACTCAISGDNSENNQGGGSKANAEADGDYY